MNIFIFYFKIMPWMMWNSKGERLKILWEATFGDWIETIRYHFYTKRVLADMAEKRKQLHR